MYEERERERKIEREARAPRFSPFHSTAAADQLVLALFFFNAILCECGCRRERRREADRMGVLQSSGRLSDELELCNKAGEASSGYREKVRSRACCSCGRLY